MAISASAGLRVLRLGTLLLEGVAKQFQTANSCGGAKYREISRKVGRPKMAISASAGPRVLRLGTLLLEGVAKQFQTANSCGGAKYRIGS